MTTTTQKAALDALYELEDNEYWRRGDFSKSHEVLRDFILAQPDAAPITGETSDGYHTFNELYEHRHMLFLALCKAHRNRAWKSKLHSDGSMFDGWFIAGLATTHGQATYHLPLRLWDSFDVEEMTVAPPWDGHTPDDVINRISSLSAAPDAQKGGE